VGNFDPFTEGLRQIKMKESLTTFKKKKKRRKRNRESSMTGDKD